MSESSRTDQGIRSTRSRTFRSEAAQGRLPKILKEFQGTDLAARRQWIRSTKAKVRMMEILTSGELKDMVQENREIRRG